MKLLLDIDDKRAHFVLELLAELPFVKTTTLTPEKAEVLTDLRDAVKNINLVKKGKAKARPLSELLDEL